MSELDRSMLRIEAVVRAKGGNTKYEYLHFVHSKISSCAILLVFLSNALVFLKSRINGLFIYQVIEQCLNYSS